MDSDRAIRKVADAYLAKIDAQSNEKRSHALKLQADTVLEAPRERAAVRQLIARKKGVLETGWVGKGYERELRLQIRALELLYRTIRE